MDTPIRAERHLSLDAKKDIGRIVIRDALQRFKRPFVVWSAGKDSTVVLHLVKSMCEELHMDMVPALFIDHGQHYDETYKMIDEVSKEWDFKVIFARNDDALSKVKDNIIRVSDLNEENQNELKRIGFKGESFEYSLESDAGNHIF